MQSRFHEEAEGDSWKGKAPLRLLRKLAEASCAGDLIGVRLYYENGTTILIRLPDDSPTDEGA